MTHIEIRKPLEQTLLFDHMPPGVYYTVNRFMMFTWGAGPAYVANMVRFHYETHQ
jgi:hypothetical protein